MTKKAAKPSKRTSARVAKIAAKYFDMSDVEIFHHISDFLPRESTVKWKAYCNDIRALAASCLSQTEAKGKK